jgi:hypothetical protein
MSPTTETSLRFSGEWPFTPILLIALGLAALMLWLYRREIRLQSAALAWLPALLRSLAVFILVLALAGPVLRHETTLRQLGRVVIALDASSSMKLTDDVGAVAAAPGAEQGRPASAARTSPTRFARAQDILFSGPQPLLKTLAETSDVELVALRGSTVQRLWWRRQGGADTSGDLPTHLDLQADAATSDLDTGLRQALGAATAGSALVVLSDGQHNVGGSPEELSTALKESAVPVFTVGFGSEISPPDLSVVDVTAPEAVFAEERVLGRIAMRDSMPAGLPGTARIESQGRVLWEQAFVTDGKGEHSLDYAFMIKDMPAAPATEADKNLRLFDVTLAISGDKAGLEKTRSNNTRQIALHLLNKKRKVLLLDGRARWETRYAHTHFERDERWQTSLAFDNYKDGADNAVAKAMPATKDELFTHDLIVLGDLSPARFKPEHIDWLLEYVEQRGGGIIFIDGSREHLREWAKTKASGLIPVEWTAASKGLTGPLSWHLTANAERAPALRLSDSPSANASLWPTLPGAAWSSDTRALPAATTLAVLKDKAQHESPGLVFSQVGAGAVLYIASDEMWRWRFQVADQYHQRLWMQLAAWIAAPPFQAESKALAIGTDHLRYAAAEQAEIRVRLRDNAGKIIADAHPRAFLLHDGVETAVLELEADPTHKGVYRAQTPPLKAGAWQVAVADSPTSPRSELRLTLRVADTGNQELSNLTMNRPLLEAIARNTHGRFLREAEAATQLPSLLQAIDRKQILTRETILWSSWWWFGAVIVLLTLEWLLRKRLRLV